METNTNTKLIKLLERKNINFKSGEKSLFNKYSYYQVINAYKGLFVSKIETINDIYINIKSGKDINRYMKSFNITSNVDLFREICKKISKKYGISFDSNSNEHELKNSINKINYIHHLYLPDTNYNDFIRMYKFEHELRLLLLRYTLIIEESVKNIFISYLNSINVSANYLFNISSYDTSISNNDALDTLKIILDKQKNKHSKPILRKREQNITIPYWILINELAMNQTYKVIKNLKPDISEQIFQRCLNFFTKASIDINDKKKNKQQINKEKELILSFRNIIKCIGGFRNILAHNQPIYCYNVHDCSLKGYPNITYDVPYINKNKYPNVSIQQQQHKINASTMYDLMNFFGPDNFNKKNYNVNINLAWIIYVIYKIISIIDKNNKMYDEMCEIFSKYNIILNDMKYELDNFDNLFDLLKEIDKINDIDLKSNEIINKIENQQSYKNLIKSSDRELKLFKRTLITKTNKIKISKGKSKYGPFTKIRRYKDYTGIDKTYFSDIK